MYESRKGLLSVDASKWCLLLVFSWHHAFAIATCFFWYGCVVFSFFWGTMLMSSLRLYPSQYRTFVTIISCVCEFVKWGPLSLTTFTRSHASHSVAHAQLSPMDSKAHQLLTINSQQEFQVLVHLQPFSLSLSGDFRSGTTSVWGIHCYAV